MDNTTGEPGKGRAKSRSGLWRLLVLLVVVAALVVAVTVFKDRVKGWLDGLLGWADGLGVWGPVVVGASYIVACVLFLPGSVITLGVGFLFGVLKGTISV